MGFWVHRGSWLLCPPVNRSLLGWGHPVNDKQLGSEAQPPTVLCKQVYGTGPLNKKQESWFRLDFLIDNGCVLHYLQYNESRVSYFPVNLSLCFLFSCQSQCAFLIFLYLSVCVSYFPVKLSLRFWFSCKSVLCSSFFCKCQSSFRFLVQKGFVLH